MLNPEVPAACRTLWLALAPAALALSAGCATVRLTPADGVIEPDAFADLLERRRGRVAIIDARPPSAYDDQHVSGAVRADPNDWKERTLAKSTGIEDGRIWREQFGRLGITGRDPVVVYDDGKLVEAARIWFLLQLFGATDVAVLNGGYPALKTLIDAGRVPVARQPTHATAVAFAPPAHRRGAVTLVDREQTRTAIQTRSAQIFDTRTSDEFTGRDPRKNPRGGHLPGATNLPHKNLLDAQGRLKSPEALAAVFEQAGFVRGQPLITHCESGGRSSLAALAATRAGFGPVSNYYRSFSDWSADRTCPVENRE